MRKKIQTTVQVCFLATPRNNLKIEIVIPINFCKFEDEA